MADEFKEFVTFDVHTPSRQQQVTIHKARAVTAPGYPPCFEYCVYQGDKLVRVCPSLGMAQEVAAGAA